MAFISRKVIERPKEFIEIQKLKPGDRLFPISYTTTRLKVKAAGRLIGIDLRPDDLRRHCSTFASIRNADRDREQGHPPAHEPIRCTCEMSVIQGRYAGSRTRAVKTSLARTSDPPDSPRHRSPNRKTDGSTGAGLIRMSARVGRYSALQTCSMAAAIALFSLRISSRVLALSSVTYDLY